MKRWLALNGQLLRPSRQGVQRALLIVALSVSVAWQWAEPQGHRLPELMRQAQQLEQQISALQTQSKTHALHNAGAASLAEQTLALRQRYWRADQAQQWLIDAQRQAQKAGVWMLDWRIAPAQPQGAVTASAGAVAQASNSPLQVRMQLQGHHAQLIRWFARQVDAMPAAQILDWQWQAQGEQGKSPGQLTLLWSLPIGQGQEKWEEEETPAVALARIGTKQHTAKPAPAQAKAPSLPASPEAPDMARGMHHWPETDLSQLRFVGLLAGTAGHHSMALLSHAAPVDAAAGPAAKASAQGLLVSVRVGDLLGARGVRVTHIDEQGLIWRSGDAQGAIATQPQ